MKQHKGFTIVELLVVIVVVTILASISYFVVNSWRKDATETQVKNELIQAANALNNTRNFSSSYPASSNFPSVYAPGADVTLSYTLRANGSFCLNGSSTVRSDVRFNIDSQQTMDPRTGICTP